MLALVIDHHGAPAALARTLAAAVPGAVAGLVAGAVVLDRTGDPQAALLADEAGCNLLSEPEVDDPAAVAGAARGEWLLLLASGEVPDAGWVDEVTGFIERASATDARHCAVFTRERRSFAIRLGDAFALARATPPTGCGLILPKAALAPGVARRARPPSGRWQVTRLRARLFGAA